MTAIANGEQMGALGLALHAHGIEATEAVDLWRTATAGQMRPLTAAEAVELTARIEAMPRIPMILRAPPCDAWPFGSWPRRTVRRHRHAE